MIGPTNETLVHVPLSLICNAGPAQRHYVNPRAMVNARPPFPLRLPWHERLHEAGGEAVLPAGSRLADEARTGRHCFLLMEGIAVAEEGGEPVGSLTSGTFVGSTDLTGMPGPPSGVTVRLVTPARVLVLEVDRLAALIEADPAVSDLWQQTVRVQPHLAEDGQA
jgi:CRP-like cAMP-binding protein